MYVCVLCACSDLRGQKRALELLELEFQTVAGSMWVLESNPLDEQQVILTTVLLALISLFQSLCQAVSTGGVSLGRAQQVLSPAETGPRCVLSNQTFPSCDSRKVTSLEEADAPGFLS